MSQNQKQLTIFESDNSSWAAPKRQSFVKSPQTLKTKKLKTFIDLFCGVGGFHLAGKRLGMHCVFASDIDLPAREVYEANFGLMPHGDICKIEASMIPDHDLLCAGFPCQPF